MKTSRLAPLLLCLCISLAHADTPLNLSHAATATAHITISNVAGNVHVTAWDRPLVQVEGRLGDGAKPLAITGSDDDLAIKVQAASSGGWFSGSHMGDTALDLHVPRGASLSVQVVSAPLIVDGMNGGKIDVNTVSGRVRINATTPTLAVDSVSGNIELAGHAEAANLQTVSGDILAPVLGAQAKLQTISGRIQASGGPWQAFSLSTVSGDVQVNGGVQASGTLTVDSMSGNVQLQLPAGTSAALHASSFSGDLRSDAGSAQKASRGPGSQLDAKLGSGAGTIKVETFSGDLRIRSAH